ncbi:MAG: hypothetical protein V1645_00220 [archaeon]
MKRVLSGLFIFGLVLSVFLLSGCQAETPTGNATVCNKPYILVGTSCCLDANDNSVCDKDEIQAPEEKPPVVPPEVKQDFQMVKGDMITVGGKNVTLVDFSIFQNKLETVVDVDGKEWVIHETQKPEIVDGLRIAPVSVDRLQAFIVLNVVPLKLESNQYLIKLNEVNIILGKVVRLREVQDDGGILVEVSVGEDDFSTFVMEGDTKTVDGLKVTNVESFHRDLRAERYAIVKIVAA